jgi:hypothetical protein
MGCTTYLRLWRAPGCPQESLLIEKVQASASSTASDGCGLLTAHNECRGDISDLSGTMGRKGGAPTPVVICDREGRKLPLGS